MLTQYAKEHGFADCEFFVDDGYSGTNYNRPDFQRMLGLVEDGKVAVICVKDLSRLGRDYLQTVIMNLPHSKISLRRTLHKERSV